METKTVQLKEETSSEKMTTLSAVMNQVAKEGYKIEFSVQANGMLWDSENQYYNPDEVTVDNFYRFEGESDPADNSILYLIQTVDGKKGVMVDAYGVYDDGRTSAFIQEVEKIQKRPHPTSPVSKKNIYLVAASLFLMAGIALLYARKKKKL